MKGIYWYLTFSLLVITLLACKQPKHRNEQEKNATDDFDTYLIAPGKVGEFEIGKPLPSVDSLPAYSIKKEERTRYTEEGPEQETVFILIKDKKEMLYLKPSAEGVYKLEEIIIHSNHYQTKEGIGVGSTISDFINAYPVYKLWYTYVSDRYILEAPQYPSIQFLLNEKDYLNKKMEIKSEITPLQVADFESDALIEKIRIY